MMKQLRSIISECRWLMIEEAAFIAVAIGLTICPIFELAKHKYFDVRRYLKIGAHQIVRK